MSGAGTEQVTVLEDGSTRSAARTGSFTVVVDPEQGAVRISHDAVDSALALSPGGSESQLLASGTVSSVRTETFDDGSVLFIVAGAVNSIEYTMTIRLPSARPETVTYDVSVDSQGVQSLVAEGWEPELAVVDGDGTPIADAFDSYLDGTPGSNPAAGTSDLTQFVYAGLDPLDATVLYLADWPSLDAYFRSTGTNMRETVATPPGRVGFVPPTTDERRGEVTSDDPLTVLAATVVLSPEALPVEEPQPYCERFVEDVADAYDCLDHPDPDPIDWRDVSQDTITAVRDEANRFEYEGTFHPGGVELVTAMSIVTPFRAYAERFDSQRAAELSQDVAAMVADYYDPDYEDAKGNTGMIGNSPEPLTLTHVDAWYLFWPVVQAAEYALAFDDEDVAEMVVDTADVMVDVGQALDYEFPMWIDVDNLTGHEPADRQWDGYQYDCTGAYAYLMCQYYDLTGDDRYLDEAEAAADRLLEYGFELPYEFTTTPLTPLAMARLADRTGDESYYEASYIGLANVVRHAYFFDPEYGSYEGRDVFLLNEAMPPEGYEGNYFANALEEWSLLYYLHRYLREGEESLSPPARRLTAELLRHKAASLSDSLTRFQPDPSLIFDDVSPQSGRRVNHDWALPLEPFGVFEPAFDSLGEIGQDLYGAGAYPEAAVQQYHPLNDNVTLWVNGPVEVTSTGNHTWEVKTLGADSTYEARLIGDSDDLVDVAVNVVADGTDLGEEVSAEYEPDATSQSDGYHLSLAAGETYAVRETVPKRAVVVEDFRLSADRIRPGQSTTVSMTVVNTSGIEGTYDVPLRVESTTRTKTVDLPAFGRVDVNITVAPEEVGTYNVTIAHENRALHVVADGD